MKAPWTLALVAALALIQVCVAEPDDEVQLVALGTFFDGLSAELPQPIAAGIQIGFFYTNDENSHRPAASRIAR